LWLRQNFETTLTPALLSPDALDSFQRAGTANPPLGDDPSAERPGGAEKGPMRSMPFERSAEGGRRLEKFRECGIAP